MRLGEVWMKNSVKMKDGTMGMLLVRQALEEETFHL